MKVICLDSQIDLDKMEQKLTKIKLFAFLLIGILIFSNIAIAEDASGTTVGTGTAETPALASGVKLPDGWTMNSDRELLFKGAKTFKVPERMQVKSINQDGNIQLSGKSNSKIIISEVGAKNIKSIKGANGNIEWYSKGQLVSVEGVKNLEMDFSDGQPSRIKLEKDSGSVSFSDPKGEKITTTFSSGGSLEVTGDKIHAIKTGAVRYDSTASDGRKFTNTLDSLAPSGDAQNKNWESTIERRPEGDHVKMNAGGITREIDGKAMPRVALPSGGEFDVKNSLAKRASELSGAKAIAFGESGIQTKGVEANIMADMKGSSVGLRTGENSASEFNTNGLVDLKGEGQILKSTPNPSDPNRPLQFGIESKAGSEVQYTPEGNVISSKGEVNIKPSQNLNIPIDKNGQMGIDVTKLDKMLKETKSQEFSLYNKGINGKETLMEYRDPFASNQNQAELLQDKNPTLKIRSREPPPTQVAQKPQQQTPQKQPELAKEKQPDAPPLNPNRMEDLKKAQQQANQNPSPNLPQDKNYEPQGYASPQYADNPSDGPVWPTDSSGGQDKPGKVNLADGLSQERIAGLGGGDLPNEGDLEVEAATGGSSAGNGRGTPADGPGTPKPGEGRYPGPQLTKNDGVTARVDGIGSTGRAGDNYRILGYTKDGKELYSVMENLRTGEKIQINTKEIAEEWGNKMYRAADYYKSSDIPSKILLNTKQYDTWMSGKFKEINAVTDTAGIQRVSFNEPPPIITDATSQQVANAQDTYFKPSVSSSGVVSMEPDDGSAKNAVKYKVTSDGKLIDPTNEKIVGSVVDGKAQLNMPVSMKVQGSGPLAGQRIVAFDGKNYIVDGGTTGAEQSTKFQQEVADALMKGKPVPEVPSDWKEYTPKSEAKEFTVSATGREVIVSGKDHMSKQVFESPEKALEEKQRLTKGGVSLQEIQKNYPNIVDEAERAKIDATLKAASKQNGDNLVNIQKFKDKYPSDFYNQKALESLSQKNLGKSLAEVDIEYARLIEEKSQNFDYLGKGKDGKTAYGSYDGENWVRISDEKKVDAKSVEIKESYLSPQETTTKTQVALDRVRAAKEEALRVARADYDARMAAQTSSSVVSDSTTPKITPAKSTSTAKTEIVQAPKGYSGDWPPKLKSAMEKPASMSDVTYRQYINDNPVPGMEEKWDSMGYGEKRFQTGKYLISERAKFEGNLKQYTSSDLQIPYQNIPTTKVESKASLGNNVYYTRFVDKGTKLADGSKSTTAIRYYYDTNANLIGFYKFATSNKDKNAGYYKLK